MKIATLISEIIPTSLITLFRCIHSGRVGRLSVLKDYAMILVVRNMLTSYKCLVHSGRVGRYRQLSMPLININATIDNYQR